MNTHKSEDIHVHAAVEELESSEILNQCFMKCLDFTVLELLSIGAAYLSS